MSDATSSATEPEPERKPRRRAQRMCPKQPEVIVALRAAHGLIEPAAIKLGMSRSNLYQYIGNHSRVAAALTQITAGFVDTLENRLFKKAVVEEDLGALKLALGAKGADRGYSGGSAAASSDPTVGDVVKVTIMSVPTNYFISKNRPNMLVNAAQSTAEFDGASEAEIAALGPDANALPVVTLPPRDRP